MRTADNGIRLVKDARSKTRMDRFSGGRNMDSEEDVQG